MVYFIHTLLILALPASGKSEIRKRLRELADAAGLHVSNVTVQLDDFPYVFLMMLVDKARVEMGLPPIFFEKPKGNFLDPRHWEVLIHLLNQDYASLLGGHRPDPVHSQASFMIDRLATAQSLAGIEIDEMPTLYHGISEEQFQDLCIALEDHCAGMIQKQQELFKVDLDQATIVIEFARGGPKGAELPLEAPYGNKRALELLSKEILKNSAVLWVRVTPEESLRKDEARAIPGEEGSDLHHCAGVEVMKGAYGTCDMQWLIDNSEGGPNTITVEAHGWEYTLTVGTFNNMPDKTTCMHSDPEDRDPEVVAALDTGIKEATDTIWNTLVRLDQPSE